MNPTDPNAETFSPVLVTGATGLVGNNIVRQLLDAGYRVRTLVRKGSSRRPLEGLNVDTSTGDLHDIESLERAMDGTAGVIHAAGCTLLGWKNARLHDRVNHLGTQHVANVALRFGCRMIYVSTVNSLGVGTRDRPADEQWVAGPNVPCPYVLSKQAGNQAVQRAIEQGLNASIVYPGYMIGPWDWKPSSAEMLLEVVTRSTPLAPSGGFSVGDVRDAALGIVTAFQRAPIGRDYVLAGHNMTYLETWRAFTRIAGGSPPRMRSGPLIRIGAGWVGDLVGLVTGREPNVNSASVKMSGLHHYFSSRRAEQELDYQVRPVDESIAEAWQWLQKHGYTDRRRKRAALPVEADRCSGDK